MSKCFKCGQLGHFGRECTMAVSGVCFKCNQDGHIAKDCSVEGADAVDTRECYRCHNHGHVAKDCAFDVDASGQSLRNSALPKVNGTSHVASKCFKCGQMGHFGRECTMAVTGVCFKCNQDGHKAKDCALEGRDLPGTDSRECYRCHNQGHLAKDCPYDVDASGQPLPNAPGPKSTPANHGTSKCFKCGQIGHFGRECTMAGSAVCFKCSQEGHIAKDCAVEGQDVPGTDSRECYRCRSQGHLAKDCPYDVDANGQPLPTITCFSCGGDGHTAKKCPVGSAAAAPRVSPSPGAMFAKPNAPQIQGGRSTDVTNAVQNAVSGALRQMGVGGADALELAAAAAQSAQRVVHNRATTAGFAQSEPKRTAYGITLPMR